MSRSYRHTPIVKSGKHHSSKEFKQVAHRVMRRETKEGLALQEEDERLIPTKMREVSDRRTSKQGRRWREFGDFWGESFRQLDMYRVIHAPYYDQERIASYLRYCKKSYLDMFYK